MFDLFGGEDFIDRFKTKEEAVNEVRKWYKDFQDEMTNEEFQITEDDFGWDRIEITQVVLTPKEIEDLVKNST